MTKTNNIEIAKLTNNTWEWGAGTYTSKFEGQEYPQIHINRNDDGDLMTIFLDETPIPMGGIDWCNLEDFLTDFDFKIEDLKRLYEFHPWCRGY